MQNIPANGQGPLYVSHFQFDHNVKRTNDLEISKFI